MIYELETRPKCCGQRLYVTQMGSNHLSVSACSHDPQGVEQSAGGGHHSNLGLPVVAQLAVVPSSPEPPSSSSLPTTPLQGDIDSGRGRTKSLPGTSRGGANFRESLTVSCSSHDFTPDELDFLANHISKGSASGYGYAWSRFASYCSGKGVDPFTCPPNIIVKYIKQIYDNGAKYRTVNYVRSAVSKLHVGFGDLPAGQHALVKKAVQAVFRLRPPLPKYKTTYDIGKVLTYVQQILGNKDLLPIKLLS